MGNTCSGPYDDLREAKKLESEFNQLSKHEQTTERRDRWVVQAVELCRKAVVHGGGGDITERHLGSLLLQESVKYNYIGWCSIIHRAPNDMLHLQLNTAFYFLNIAAKTDYHAMYLLAHCYARGYGTPVDAQKAFQLSKVAADVGHFGQAALQVFGCYYRGAGTQRHLLKSMEYWRAATRYGMSIVAKRNYFTTLLQNFPNVVFYVD